jgi:serine/threonine protein kinase
LHNLGRFTEEQARFYISEILIGLEYLHGKDIAYRDLKPENILLDLDGHIKITDFGLSKQNIKAFDLSSSFCGSPEYMSPEMLQGKGHGRAVDFYSIGALLFEMLVGVPPFYSQNRSSMYSNILNSSLSIPSFISKNCKDLLEKLLNKQPENRLGYSLGTKEIRMHPWFKGISWSKVKNRRLIPPYRPNFRHSNFDSEYLKVGVNFELFKQERLVDDPLFPDFEFNVKSRNNEPVDSLLGSTESSRHGISQNEECGATKVKLFMPTVVPKQADDDVAYASKHRRAKDISISSIIKEVNQKTKNLVQELRPVTSQRQTFRKGNKPVSQDFINLSSDLLQNR